MLRRIVLRAIFRVVSKGYNVGSVERILPGPGKSGAA